MSNALPTKTLSEQIEEACAEANRLYVAGQDTTDIDNVVDDLMARFDAGER